MKKIFLFLTVLGMIFSVGCGSSQNEAASDKPQIYCSFYGIYDFVSEIGGDKIDVYNIVPTGTEPHDWEPSTRNMAELSNADIIFYNGLGMETWIDKVEASVGENVEFVELSDGIADEDSSNDPHIWLAPKNAEKMCEAIKNKLCDIDPENSSYYESSYSNIQTEMEELDSEYIKALAPYKGGKIVVAHEAYSYLCDEYGLQQTAIEGLSAESEPSPSKMQELVNYIKDNNIKYVFYEELVSPKVAQSLADEAGAELLELNPIEGLTDEQIKNGDNYISIMRSNLENLKTALGAE